MTHFALINVRSRRVPTRNAVLRSLYSRIPQIALRLPAACIALHHSAFSPAPCLPHSSRRNNGDPSTSPLNSHRHARIHPRQRLTSNGSIVTTPTIAAPTGTPSRGSHDRVLTFFWNLRSACKRSAQVVRQISSHRRIRSISPARANHKMSKRETSPLSHPMLHHHAGPSPEVDRTHMGYGCPNAC